MSKPSRQDRLIEDTRHDPYRATGKQRDPSVCPDCNATFREGRWSWKEGPFDAPRVKCPACRRIADDYPAGLVRIHGAYALERRDELEQLLRNLEAREREEHPLKRILDVQEGEGEWTVRTTDVHLARSLGQALERAHGGRLEMHQAEDQVRLDWSR